MASRKTENSDMVKQVLPIRLATELPTYPDPSAGKEDGPVCLVTFQGGEGALLAYSDGRVRVYLPGKVDGRILPLKPQYINDMACIAQLWGASKEEPIHALVPVSLVSEVWDATFDDPAV